MVIRRPALALASAALLLVTASSVFAQEAKKLSKDEEREAKLISNALGNAVQGKPVTNDLAITWLRSDGLRLRPRRL